MKITFFGGVGQVTGSRYVVEEKGTRVLVDCGMFQGPWEVAKQNLNQFPVGPSSINAVVLTHAHIDHTGYLPRLVKDGFSGPIYCSKATFELCQIMLVDSASLLEQEAERYKRKPLYTKADAERALRYFHTIDYDTPFEIGSLTITLIASYHILGAAFIAISDGKRTLTFSGDLGRPHSLTMKSPPPITTTDYVVLESTYGDRLHETGDPLQEIEDIVNHTVKKGGVLVIPSFAVGRTQTILYCLYQLRKQDRIPKIPIYLDSPMGIKTTDLFCKFKDEHSLSLSTCHDAFDIAVGTPTVQDSKRLNDLQSPAIILAGSGMAEGGRALYHFQHYITDKKNTIMLVGYQGEDTGGRALLDGAKKMKIYGRQYPVRADIKNINLFSAHADYNEILQWLSHFKAAPKKVFLTHGELDSAEALQEKIEKQFGWNVVVPQYGDSFELD